MKAVAVHKLCSLLLVGALFGQCLAADGLAIQAPCKVEATSRHVGEFRREGEYVKDFFFLKEGDTFHLFYNVGKAAAKQDWQDEGNEKAFGHATSKNLRAWTHHERVLPVVAGTWEGQVVSAPSILKHHGKFFMVYSGFDDRVFGKQAIGLATSTNLFQWTRYPGNPVYTMPDWATAHPSGWVDCRDAHIIRHGGEFLLYTMVTTKAGEGAIALASSANARTWTDLGPVVLTFRAPESPRVFEHAGTFYLFASSSFGKKLFKTKWPKSKNWEEVPFRWPEPGLWSGWEVVEDGARTIFAAFLWEAHGNFIHFWEVEWQGEVPMVKY